jgi:2-amino-4-hydroxy-6-hydroxymethyldihydropteridine diphosphokinase
VTQILSPNPNATPILVALGANLISERYGTPIETLEAALGALAARDIRTLKRSRWFESAPVPISDQPWYVNGVISVRTPLSAEATLSSLHEIEAEFGRVRQIRNEARVLDLDLIAYGDLVIDQPGGMIVPHPRLAERAFVLLPLADILPDWRHPASGLGLSEMIEALPQDQMIRPVGAIPSGALGSTL